MTNMSRNINQDGVDQCTSRMREALSEGDTAKANKFMEKAVRLGADAAEMKRLYTSMVDATASYAGAAAKPRSGSGQARQRRGTSGNRAGGAANGTARPASGTANGTSSSASSGGTTGGRANPGTAGNARPSGGASASSSTGGSARQPTARPGTTGTTAGASSRPSAQSTSANSASSRPSGASSARPSAAPTGGATASRPSTASSSSRPSNPPPARKDYTPEQMQLVQKILRTKDYYAIFGLEKSASVDEIKKAYKKMALKLHPDKNGAPGAEEAFKKLSKAVQCLSDEKKRRTYDRFGDPDRAEQQAGPQFRQDDFMSANDFFEMFFNGGNVVHRHARGGVGAQRGGGGGPNLDDQRAQLLQLLPLFFLLFTALFSSNMFQPTPQRKFSWRKDLQFQLGRKTPRLKAVYYVSKSFDGDFPEQSVRRREFEHAVELDFIRGQQSECEYQEKQMWRRVMQARRHQDPKVRAREVERAKAVPRQACEALEKIKQKHPGLYRNAQGYDDFAADL
ncbi:unnamed protein product [Amoebophrya sp. A25]|nr:unnamed protein product [Amoebophrya sp. A25]|eukprot:GSA25T00007008001.1